MDKCFYSWNIVKYFSFRILWAKYFCSKFHVESFRSNWDLLHVNKQSDSQVPTFFNIVVIIWQILTTQIDLQSSRSFKIAYNVPMDPNGLQWIVDHAHLPLIDIRFCWYGKLLIYVDSVLTYSMHLSEVSKLFWLFRKEYFIGYYSPFPAVPFHHVRS